MDISTKILSNVIVFMKYGRYDKKLGRRETWEELVTRNKNMHVKKFPKLKKEIEEVYKFVYDKKVLPSMRGLQFGGKPIVLNPSRQYNCAFMHMNHPDAFKELMFLLLSGCGVGYSVQTHHIAKLPEINKPIKERRFLIADSIEGWADAVGALVGAYLGDRKSSPAFDYNDIRPKGRPLKTSGGVAPGPEPLKTCLHHIQTLLERKQTGEKLSPLEVHDINCHLADAVLSGGVRRSAMISLFSFRDEEMRTSKFGKWFEDNPQRGRANNSAVILRHKISEEEFQGFWEVIKNSGAGEPGIFFTNDQEVGTNPCGEISLKSSQFCNLVTINASSLVDQEDYNQRAVAASFIATLQASYTNFHYLREIWQETTEKDALIGVSMTGIATGSVLDLNMKEAAKLVIEENKRVSDLLGTHWASRTTTVKPEGTSSLVLGCSSGIHAWHHPYYIRRVGVEKEEAIYKYLKEFHPDLLEDDFFKPTTLAHIKVPIRAPEKAVFRSETALQFLARVSKVYKEWVKPGYLKGHNHNNISCTVSIKPNEWDRVGSWMWENRNNYTAITVLPYSEHSYVQPPYEDADCDLYNKTIKKIKQIDLTQVTEDGDYTKLKENLACSGNACEVK